MLLVGLPLYNNQGYKRPLENSLHSNEHSKRSSLLNDSIFTDLIELKEKVSELEARIKKLEDKSMCMHNVFIFNAFKETLYV